MLFLRRILILTTFALAALPAGSALAAQCEDCEPPPGSGGGGGGTTYATPDTTITAGGGLVATKRPTFSFKSDLPFVTFRCRWAGSAGAAWSEDGAADCGTSGAADSVIQWMPQSDLGQGTQYLQVRACKVHTATVTKCDASPGVRSVTVDTIKPNVDLTAGPEWDARLNTRPTFGFKSSDGGVQFFCGGDTGKPWLQCPGDSWTYPENTPDGEHHFWIKTVDAAGNESGQIGVRWYLDTTRPAITFSPDLKDLVTTHRPTWTWTESDNDADLKKQCFLEWNGPTKEIPCTAAERSWTPSEDLADGQWTFSVMLTDSAGNVGFKRYWLRVDTTAPELGDIAWDATTEKLSYTAADGPLECRFDGGDGFACGTTVSADHLADGMHTFTVTLKDEAGNVATKSKTFRVGPEPKPDPQPEPKPDPQQQQQGGDTPVVVPAAEQPRGAEQPLGADPQPPVVEQPRGADQPRPTTTPTGTKKPAVKKRCVLKKKKVRGKTRKVRVCTKKSKPKKRAAKPRRG